MIFDEMVLKKRVDDRYEFLSKLGKYLRNHFDIVKEHDSTHYIDYIYITIEHNNLKIKLYWCDEINNYEKICIDIISYDKKNINTDIIKKIKDIVQIKLEK